MGYFQSMGTVFSSKMDYIDESVGSIMTKLDAGETYDEDGNATYYLFSLDDQFEGQVEDNNVLRDLYTKYAKAIVINFIEIK